MPMTTLTLVLLLSAGQLPTPTKLVEARGVFLAGDGIDRATLVELGQQLTEWGRWTLQADQGAADIVLVLSRAPSGAGGEGQGWMLTIRDASPAPLYSDIQAGTYAAGAVTQLVGRLKAAIQPGDTTEALGSTAVLATAPAAAPSQEPCRVFVTEEKVNPSFFTVVKSITYRKKYYGGSSHAWEGMAREGWKANADAVVAVNINFRPSMFSWASPHGEGTAVRWNDEGRRQFSKLHGQCFPKPVD
jgi:hypothetical protein